METSKTPLFSYCVYIFKNHKIVDKIDFSKHTNFNSKDSLMTYLLNSTGDFPSCKIDENTVIQKLVRGNDYSVTKIFQNNIVQP